MDIEKPQPMQIGGTYHYTLSSYDPVEIEVDVMHVSDADVERSFRSLVAEQGGDAETADDAWVAEHFEGLDAAGLRAELRRELETYSSAYAEEQKPARCAQALAKRLGQAVPDQVVAAYERMLRERLAAELREGGSSLDELSGRLGAATDEALRAQARDLAEQDAALDAFVAEKRLKVADEEIPGLLRIPADKADEVMRDAEEHGATGELRRAALQAKAVRSLVAECACTYRHETPEEAARRDEAYDQALRAAQAREDLERGISGDDGAADGEGFKLV